MCRLRIRLPMGALAGAFVVGGTAAVQAHAVCGDRIFPATLAIDDPGITDELSLPTLQWFSQTSNGVGELDASVSWSKTIFPNLALSIVTGPTWLRGPGGFGWDALDTEVDFFMDDIFPDSLGKPLFSQSLPMFTGARQ